MACRQQRSKASLLFRLIRFGGALTLAAGILGSRTLFSERVTDPSKAMAQSRTAFVAHPINEAPAVLWRPSSAGERQDLFYGPGGAAHQPDSHDTFTFVQEDLSGSHPKFEVRDSHGVGWKVKLGTEARPETVATRLVWAAGYWADEDYFVDEMHVDGMPARLHRGQRLVDAGGIVRNVRLKRISDHRKDLGQWAWRRNPFSGTRELNGLRVLMAIINNWDVKDVNNAIYEMPRDGGASERVFEVKDLGSSFGSSGLERTDHANGDLSAYRRTPFITRVTAETVSFRTPRLPDWIVIANVPQFYKRLGLRWIGKDIPRSDARWMGQLLSRLSRDQVRDAFRAAGYAPDEVEGFAAVLESRIRQLTAL